MELFLERDPQTPNCTEGTLFVGGVQECFTLELPWRDNRPKESCIPPGRYRVVITWSQKFQRMMPEILGVRDRSGIRIHWGNSAKDTEGCPLVGTSKGFEEIENSKAAFDRLFAKLNAAQGRKEPIFLTVQDPEENSTKE